MEACGAKGVAGEAYGDVSVEEVVALEVKQPRQHATHL